jgi:hypothetical protein
MLLQEVTVVAEEVWRDVAMDVREGDEVSFVVLGTGIGRSYDPGRQSLQRGKEVVVFLSRRPIGWREEGARMLLTLSAGYSGVYSVMEGGRVECAGNTDPVQVRSRSVRELRSKVRHTQGPPPSPVPW